MGDPNPPPNVLNRPVYSEEQKGINIAGQLATLPTGACKFHESGQQCGCRQYFNETFGRSASGSLYFCMCSHHACFHEQGDSTVERASTQLLRSQDAQSGSGYVGGRPHGTAIGTSGSNPFSGLIDVTNTQIGSQGSRLTISHMQNSLPDTLPWSHSAGPSQSGLTALPPIPSQCLFPSQDRIDRENAIGEGTQTTESVVFSERRAFADVRANSFLPVQNKNPQPSSVANHQGNSGQGSDHNAAASLSRSHDQYTADSESATGSLSHSCLPPIRSIRREVSHLSTVVKAQ